LYFSGLTFTSLGYGDVVINGRVRLIGVLYEDTKANGLRWYQEKGGHWTNLLDPRGRMAIDYGVRGVPETFFITRDRHILYHLPRPVTPEILDTWVAKLLAAMRVVRE